MYYTIGRMCSGRLSHDGYQIHPQVQCNVYFVYTVHSVNHTYCCTRAPTPRTSDEQFHCHTIAKSHAPHNKIKKKRRNEYAQKRPYAYCMLK